MLEASAGPAALHLELRGPIAAPQLEATGRVADADVTLQATLRDDALAIDAAVWSRNDSRLTLRGAISRTADAPSDVRLTGSAALADLAALPWLHIPVIDQWKLDGTLAVQVRARGDLRRWTSLQMLGVIRTDALSISGVPLRNASVELEQTQEKLSVRLTQASLAGGRLSGRAVLDWQQTPTPYLCELDAIQVDLGQLAAQLPAWKDKTIDGQASGHVSVLGAWNDAAGAHGDGWLKATGQRLADVPLLNKFFKNIVLGSLADWIGLSNLRTAQIASISGTFQLRNERVMTDSLTLSGAAGLEPIAFYVQGSAGFDKTLDVNVETDLSEQMLSDAMGKTTLAGRMLKAVGSLQRMKRLVGRYHIGGTLDKPEPTFEYSFDQTLSRVLQSVFNVLP